VKRCRAEMRRFRAANLSTECAGCRLLSRQRHRVVSNSRVKPITPGRSPVRLSIRLLVCLSAISRHPIPKESARRKCLVSVAAVCLLVAVPAHATLINLGTITRDPFLGIDWLDPVETAGLSIAEALAANPGWEVATGGQVCSFVDRTEPVAPWCGIAPHGISGYRPWGTTLGLWGLTYTNGSTIPEILGDGMGLAALSIFSPEKYIRMMWSLPPSHIRARTGASSPRPLYLTECLLIGPKENAA
jgi:hypothetical protein